jgi:hypothetical protein
LRPSGQRAFWNIEYGRYSWTATSVLAICRVAMAYFGRDISYSSVRYGRDAGATRGLTDMDCALTDRQAHFRNKVRDFMEVHGKLAMRRMDIWKSS